MLEIEQRPATFNLAGVKCVDNITSIHADGIKEKSLAFSIEELFNYVKAYVSIHKCCKGYISLKCNWYLNHHQREILIKHFIKDDPDFENIDNLNFFAQGREGGKFKWVFKPIL